MLSSRTQAIGEPPTKKARISRQKSAFTHQLPSPDAAPGSSSENAGLLSSISPKRKPFQSFRDRLFTHAEETTPEESNGIPTQQKPRSKTSIAPIFKQNLAAAFQVGAEPSKHVPTIREQPTRELSPETGPDDLIKRLKKHYRESAETIQERAMIHLQQAHSDVSRRFREATKGEEAFLAKMEQQHKTLCEPLDKLSIRSRVRDPVDGSARQLTKAVESLVADVETQAAEFEADLAKLWKELEVADAEVARVYRENLTDGRDAHGGAGEAAQIADVLTQLWAGIKKQIQGAEDEIADLGDAAVAAMKDVEKEYRKVTLPDLHIFFKSIDEP
ncbi:hypothetical protein B0T16DRAFT_404154 [Cercophora newfieldiana]|uniref:Uncharacterized protein n=1 Tax=Cercophora newfieldiana TaxID=92897 RepID=A0AA39YHC1_9PEZI|nr:hypothetical protein B0T16DRAFT_404154 [Cercophora newfieldiana]